MNDGYRDTMLDICVEQSRRNLSEAKSNADLAKEMARDPKGFNGKFASVNRRVQKCPACGERIISEEIDQPFICQCGWRSDKTNGKPQ